MTTNENDNNDDAHHPSHDCYMNSALYYNEENDDDFNGKTFLLNDDDDRERRKKSSRMRKKNAMQTLPSFVLQKRLINLRSVLLALSLSLTLLVFWLLDSLKDPVFATMVEGNLNKHQPLAKMASVAGTLVLVIMMEVVSNGRKNEKDNVNGMAGDEIESDGGKWTKMLIGRKPAEHGEEEDDNADNKIPISLFRFVGAAYILIFGGLSFLISLHPEFNDGAPDNLSDESKRNSAWYALGYLQYIMIESYGSIAVATFWSFANSTLTLKAAKTFYGFIIAIAQVGAIGGSTIATLPNVSIPSLFASACVGILIQIGVMHVYSKYFPYAMSEDDDIIFFDDDSVQDHEAELNRKAAKARRNKEKALSNSEAIKVIEESSDRPSSMKVFFSGVFLIMKYNYLLLILGVSCLYEVSLTCLDYEMKLIGLDRFTAPTNLIEDMNEAAETYTETESTADAFATFMGRYGQLTNLLSLLLSYFLFPYLMESHGLKQTLRIFPSLLLFIMFMAFVALPMNLPVLFVSMSVLKAMTYSINDPAKEILYIPTSNVVKFKAKFWIDVVGARIAKAIGSTINTYAGTAERIVQYGSLPSVVTALGLWVVCYAAGMKFDELLENGEIIGIEEDEAQIGPGFSYEDGDVSDEDDYESDFNEYTSESGWESNVSVELVRSNVQ
mmetsp:Transcript_8238/g.12414  ORF Transcript_8238/g.12414 Transcript_8238/m.12414 type:complete len:669 (-) Transcript_8238:118-2124(-)|eukprot:CAMPEP_0203680802 /NCGR_PEP_ID=MMETSP0090-20130426/40649_1 /ASSEMBLY_ACC=CAM_ASM_001088 /TAXON_ID=426623 /ORGANISM="Chaetoceros affinis, Strain CCMP159" /LENGTH=668 /DNA_ID=CAMNT_0050549041 /DNA_START=71 /DNA_END=2077 /DNA_ORIENTATION=+